VTEPRHPHDQHEFERGDRHRPATDVRFDWMLAIVIAILLYLLSFAPVMRVIGRRTAMGPAVETFYMPIIWLHSHTPLKSTIEAYARLWGVR